MRLTIDLPDDIHGKIALDALKKRRNSKERVITEILRAHYGGGGIEEGRQALLQWRISPRAAKRIGELRQLTKAHWK